jgi:uncharacterized protein YcbK (DUF882 family)
MMAKFALVVVALLAMVLARTEAIGQVRAPTDHKTQKKPSSYIGKTKAIGKPKAVGKSKAASAASRKVTTAARVNTKRPTPLVVGRGGSGGRIVTRTVSRQKRPLYRPATKVVAARYAARLRPCADPRRARRSGCATPQTFLPPAPVIDEAAPRALSLVNVHTGEAVTVTFWRDGGFVQSALDRLNDVLRDNRNDSQVQMDPELFNVLWRVRQRLRSTAAWRVLSAYRSPETNAWLASFTRGVARDSLHMRGQAIDVVLPSHSAGQVRAAALALGLGGVGYYPRSGFVHLDTGLQRSW